VNDLAVQSKQNPVAADSEPVAALVSFQLLDISLEGTLEHVETVADVAADFLGQSAQLLQGSVIDGELVNHDLLTLYNLLRGRQAYPTQRMTKLFNQGW
jgi:hypothetical protein